MKWKIKLCLMILLCSLIPTSFAIVTTFILSSQTFNLFFPSNSALRIQTTTNIYISVESGSWNGTSATMRVIDDRGAITFLNNEDVTLRFEPGEKPDRILDVFVEGGNLTQTDDYQWQILLYQDRNACIKWIWQPESWVDKYTYLAMGLTGAVMIVFAPTWVAWKVRDRGFDPDSMERIAYAMIVFLIGLGFIFVWLWG